jgi:hypothetical protein
MEINSELMLIINADFKSMVFKKNIIGLEDKFM